MKENRLLHMMGEIEDGYIEEAGADAGKGRKPKRENRNYHVTFRWKKWCTVAASLAVVAGLIIAAMQSGVLGGKNHEVVLENGDKITFVKAEDFIMADQKIAGTGRKITEEEAAQLFSGISVTTGFVWFDLDEGNFMGIEGEIGDIDLFVAKKGMMIDDTIVMGEETISMVNDIEVTAGYFLMRPNSKGERRIIYYANFEIGNTTFGLEYAGAEAEAEKLCTELADVIEKLIQNGEPDFSDLEK